MGRPVHFEIPTAEPEQLADFYRQAFGWTITKWEGPMDYWLVTTGEGSPGIDGAIMRAEGVFERLTNVIDVDAIDDAVGRLESAGAQIVLPKHAVPGVGHVAYFRDPGGNILGIIEADEAATA